MPPDKILDASGLTCPLPVLKARKLLIGMRPGEVLEVVTTDPMSVVDMPVFCAQAGHTIIREEKQDSRFVFAIARGSR
jgi:tRNA 2-thiouridine synthesizing protein A